MVQLKLEMGKKKFKASKSAASEERDPDSVEDVVEKPLKRKKKSNKSRDDETIAETELDTTTNTKGGKMAKNKKQNPGKFKVRARKLFPSFMTYLQSYQKFAEDLPRHFMLVDEEKLAELREKSEEEDASGSEQKPTEEDEEKMDSEEEEMLPKKGRGPQFGNATRAKTISELRERLEKMKNKSLSYEERLKKKGLKTRLTKKQRLEERAKLKKEKRKVQKSKGNPMKPAVNDDVEPVDDKKPLKEPKMIFSKIEIPQEEGLKKRENKDPKRLLQKIQKSESKLKELEQKGRTETVKKIKEKLTWDKAIQKAEGVKVKDDVELLKKTIKRKEGIKAHSKKKWDKRLESIEKRKMDSQKKRQENIAKKKKEIKQKKIKKSMKKGRVKI